MWISTAVVLLVIGLVGPIMARRGFEGRERTLALGSLFAHALAAFAQVWIIESVYGGVTDAAMYAEHGKLIARLLEIDFWRWLPEVIRLGLHIESSIPFEVFGEGVSTGTMSAITGTIFFFVGDHLLPAALLIGSFSWFGKLLLFRTAAKLVEPSERLTMMIGMVGVPSVIFWSAAVAKEAVMMGWFGPLAFGAYGVLVERRLSSLLWVVLGGIGVGLIKPYVLFPFMLGAGTSLIAVATKGRFRFVYAVIGLVVMLGGLVALGELFPEYSANQIAERTADLQYRGALIGEEGGGSYVEIGSADSSSFTTQLRFVPLALVNTFFRPVIFEARNITSLAAAIENTALTFAVLSVLVRLKPSALWRAVFEGPVIAFCVVFTLAFAVGVGLATTNLGTLSRYRVPMMPFYVAGVLLLRRRLTPLPIRHPVAT